MASGSFNLSFTSDTSQYITGVVQWSSTPNISANTSTVTATMKLSRTNIGYTTWGTGSFWIEIDGTRSTNTLSYKITYNSNTVMVTATKTVTHNSNGSKSITIKWGGGGGANDSVTVVQGSGTAVLDNIPRASVPTVTNSNVTLGNAVTINTNRASSSFTHKLFYSVGTSGWQSIATNVGASYSWTPPVSLANYITTSTSATCTIKCETYNGSTLIGSKNVTLTLNVPSNIVPSLTFTLNGQMLESGRYIQNRSIAYVNPTFISAYGSTASSYEIKVSNSQYNYNVTYTSTSYEIRFPYDGDYVISARVKDSRGRYSNYYTISINVLTYFNPTIFTFNVYRSTSSGAPDDSGAYATWEIFTSVAPLTYNGTNLNTVSITFQYRKQGNSTYTNLSFTPTYQFMHTGTISISTDYAYEFRLILSDKYTTISKTITIPSAYTLIDFHSSKRGLAFGKVADTQNLFDVAMPARFSQQVTFTGNITTDTINVNQKIILPTDKYQSNGGALDANDSDIIKVNGLYFADVCTSNGEGLLFPRSGAPSNPDYNSCDRLYVADGIIYLNGRQVDRLKYIKATVAYMNPSQYVSMSGSGQKLSECPHGWVLVWSEYSGGSAKNTDFVFSFIPRIDRIINKTFNSSDIDGSTVLCYFPIASEPSKVVNKVLRLADDVIYGHSWNTSTPEGLNIVLREIWAF